MFMVVPTPGTSTSGGRGLLTLPNLWPGAGGRLNWRRRATATEQGKGEKTNKTDLKKKSEPRMRPGIMRVMAGQHINQKGSCACARAGTTQPRKRSPALLHRTALPPGPAPHQ